MCFNFFMGLGAPIKRRVEPMSQALVSGAGKLQEEGIRNKYHSFFISLACDLIQLGTIEVTSPVGDAVIAEAVGHLAALDLPIMTVVNFKASNTGITITDSANGYDGFVWDGREGEGQIGAGG